MTVLERLKNAMVVPVVVIDDQKDAVNTAKALLKGGIDVMEITMRTQCAPDAIKEVSENCPEMLVGAGTVLNVEQCKLAVKMGAKFIVSPGLAEDAALVCRENNIPILVFDLKRPDNILDACLGNKVGTIVIDR